MDNQLVLIRDNNNIETAIPKFPFIIGSFPNQTDLYIQNPDVAPLHCQIIERDGKFYIQDLNSRIGTQLNQVQIEPGTEAQLNSEDIITIGDINFIFVLKTIELFDPNEIETLNQDFDKMVVEVVPEKRMSLATQIIRTLGDKILLVNDTATKKEMTIAEAIKCYLSDVIDLDTKNTEEKSVERANASSRKIEVKPQIQEPKKSGIQSRRISFKSNSAPKVESKPILTTIVLEEIQAPYEKIVIDKFPFNIGRADDLNEYALPRRGVSRVHATISRNGNDFYIIDNNATNGTFVNNRQIINRQEKINTGDIISLYEYKFRVK